MKHFNPGVNRLPETGIALGSHELLIFTFYLLKGVVVLANPSTACESVKPQSSYNQSGYTGYWFLLIDAGDCEYDTKVCYVFMFFMFYLKN